MSRKNNLLVDYCNFEAAKYAVMNWHYSHAMPAGKLVKVGAWENSRFIGAVIYGLGANNNIGKAYGLSSTETCELVRVALNEHKSPVSQIVAYSIKKLIKTSPGLRLIVSYADTKQGHSGTIYQAMNWVYVGATGGATEYLINGKLTHSRSVSSAIPKNKTRKQYLDSLGSYEVVKSSLKHKYLYPLDDDMKKAVQSLALPYPKKEA